MSTDTTTESDLLRKPLGTILTGMGDLLGVWPQDDCVHLVGDLVTALSAISSACDRIAQDSISDHLRSVGQDLHVVARES